MKKEHRWDEKLRVANSLIEATKCICACHGTEFNSMKLHSPVLHSTKCCEMMNGLVSSKSKDSTMLTQDKIKEELTDKVFQSVMEDIGKHYKVSDRLSDILIDSLSLHLPSALAHLSAQYEKLIEECMPEKLELPKRDCINAENHMFGSCFECEKMKGYNACLATIRTSLQERGIINK